MSSMFNILNYFCKRVQVTILIHTVLIIFKREFKDSLQAEFSWNSCFNNTYGLPIHLTSHHFINTTVEIIYRVEKSVSNWA